MKEKPSDADMHDAAHPADWSDEELEGLQQGQAMVVADPNAEFGADDVNGDEPDRSAGRNLLTVRLTAPFAANALLVKLIDQEDLMNEFHDEHSYPNLDMTYVQCVGKVVQLPGYVTLA